MSLNILALHPLTSQQTTTISAIRDDVCINSCKVANAVQYMPETDILLSFEQTNLVPLLDNAPRLKWIHALTAGVERFFQIPGFAKSDILLTNSRGIHGIPIAEQVLGIMLNSSRCLFTSYEQQKKHLWKRIPNTDELYEKTVAIIGLGSIGREIAKRTKSLGMNVLAVKREKTTEPFVDQLYSLDDLTVVLNTADYVVVTLPLTDKTKNMFTLPIFKQMKTSAYFINVSRGPIVSETDLCAALTEDIIHGAALDVFCEEPLPESSPLWDTKNLLITPHNSASSPYYIDRTLRIFNENLRHFPQSSEMINLIDKTRGY